MSWDPDRFRLEVGRVMTVSFGDGPNLAAKWGADIWLMEDGKATTRKKAATIVEDSLPELLRVLAAWIEENDDVGLRRLVKEFQERRQ